MLGSLATNTLVSYVMHRLWVAGKLEGRRDFFHCMKREAETLTVPKSIDIDAKELDHDLSAAITDESKAEEKSDEKAIDGDKVQTTEENSATSTLLRSALWFKMLRRELPDWELMTNIELDLLPASQLCNFPHSTSIFLFLLIKTSEFLFLLVVKNQQLYICQWLVSS